MLWRKRRIQARNYSSEISFQNGGTVAHQKQTRAPTAQRHLQSRLALDLRRPNKPNATAQMDVDNIMRYPNCHWYPLPCRWCNQRQISHPAPPQGNAARPTPLSTYRIFPRSLESLHPKNLRRFGAPRTICRLRSHLRCFQHPQSDVVLGTGQSAPTRSRDYSCRCINAIARASRSDV